MEQNKVLSVANELVSFQSVTPYSAGSLEYIVEYFAKYQPKVTWLNRNETKNIIVRFGNGHNSLAFAGHTDVVPVGDLDKWENDPFVLTQYGDKIIGRGIADMKGSIACFMVALEEQLAHIDLEKHSIYLLITSDEEGPADDGTILMVEYLQQHDVKIDYCIVGEPSSVTNLGDVIKVGRRGSLNGEVTVKGVQGHIAYPHLCDNPINNSTKAFADLVAIKWDEGSEFFPPTSMQFSNINSGVGVTNVIPNDLVAVFNFRYSDKHTYQDLQTKVEEIFNQNDLKYTINWRYSAKPFMTKLGKLYETTKKSIKNNTGIDVDPRTDGGTSDGRFLVDVCNELLELGLINKTIHQINEESSIKDLVSLTNIYADIIKELFSEK